MRLFLPLLSCFLVMGELFTTVHAESEVPWQRTLTAPSMDGPVCNSKHRHHVKDHWWILIRLFDDTLVLPRNGVVLSLEWLWWKHLLLSKVRPCCLHAPVGSWVWPKRRIHYSWYMVSNVYGGELMNSTLRSFLGLITGRSLKKSILGWPIGGLTQLSVL